MVSGPIVSDEQKEQAVNAVKEHGSIRGAARKLGIPESTLRCRLKKLIPNGQKLKGLSTLYDEKGIERLQWVKTTADEAVQREMMEAAVNALREKIPAAKPHAGRPVTLSDLVSTYILTDYHMGMMAWSVESGEDWNTQRSEEFLVMWFQSAIKAAPASHTAILAQLGDFLHYDSLTAITPTSKHPLDTDAKYAQIVRVVIRALCRIVDLLLDKHQHVHIIMAEGNHDLASSVWLRALFAERYKNDTRVTVDLSESGFYMFEWGKTSLFFHHGHNRKFSEISNVFAGLYREVFGRTKYSYAHMGHLHHIQSKENNLMIVEQHTTMAPKDSYSAKHGFLSNRGANVISYSKEYGEVSRMTIRPEMIS